MTDPKLRIPRLVVAALVLGACSDDSNGPSGTSGTSGTNGTTDTSSARVGKIADMYCSKYAECYPADFAENYDSKADCTRVYATDFNGYVETYGKDCGDAVMDLIECDFVSECDFEGAIDDKCSAQLQRAKRACPELDFEDDSASSSSSDQLQSTSKRRSLRIPR